VKDSFRVLWVLWEKHSEETVVLPPGEWAMAFDPQGRAYVSPTGEGEPLWCRDLCSFQVAPDPKNANIVYIRLPSGDVLRRESFKARHEAVSIPLRVVGRAKPELASAFLLHQAVGGCRIQWSVVSLFKTFVTADRVSQAFSDWYYPHSKQRLARLEKLGLESRLHQRQTVRSKSLMPEVESERIFDKVTWSTVAALLFLTRLAFGGSRSSSIKDELVTLSWKLALQSLLQSYARDTTLGVFVDASVVLALGRPAQGRHPVILQVVDGHINLKPLLELQEQKGFAFVAKTLRSVISCLAPGRSPRTWASLDSLLCALEGGNKPSHWLFLQLVYGLSGTIEEACQHSFEAPAAEGSAVSSSNHPASVLETRRARQHRVRLASFARRMRVVTRVPQAVHEKVLRYFFSLRRAFAEATRLSIAVDASRVGGRNRLFGFLANDRNVGGWAPPQARGDGLMLQVL